MTVKLLTEQPLEFLSLNGDCTGLSESTIIKIPHCFTKKQDNLGQELQCTINVKELTDLSKVLNFQDAKNNVFKLIKIKIVSFVSIDHKISLTTRNASVLAIYLAFNVTC